MFKTLLLFVPAFFCSMTAGYSQGVLSGVVTNAGDSEPLPLVNVFISELERGNTTNSEGEYTISNIPAGTYSITVSFVGFQSYTEDVAIQQGENRLDVELLPENILFDDIVVTALGVRRSERSIGFAAQQVEGELLTQTREVNLINALSGRTAGVTISSSSGQPGAGSRIVIRGNSSMRGDNQPLFVVDGIPVSNDFDENIHRDPLFTGGASTRGIDIDPSNIEDITVLRGAGATALYGSRASNGAILITTKSGTQNQPPTIQVTSSLTWDEAYTEGYQTEYLGGTNGYYYNGLPAGAGGYVEPGAPGSNSQTLYSWGPHVDRVSQQVLDDLGVERVETFNPRADFYQTGVTADNSVNLSGGTETSAYYFSAGNIDQEGIVPETTLNRTSLRARFSSDLTDKFNVESSVSYMNTRNHWLSEGGAFESYLLGLNISPVNFDITKTENEDGSQRMSNSQFNNPFWIAENNGYDSDVDRFIAGTTLRYSLLPWLDVTERIGIDSYTDNRKGMVNVGTRFKPSGNMFDQTLSRSQINSDLTLTGTRNLNEDLTLEFLTGNNVNIRSYRSEEIFGNDLNIPDFFHISNANSVDADEYIEEQRMVSLYSRFTIDYRNIFYLTLTGRNDWSSTLPKENNSYFYPSVSAGFIFTDAFDLFDDTFLTYGKLRASLSQIGNDAPPYSLTTTYVQANPVDGEGGSITYPFNGVNGYRLQAVIGNPELKPEISSEYEFGLDLRMFEGRARMDIAYYDRSTVDQIFEVPVSSATGYISKLANAGEIRNYGLEVTLGGSPVQTRDFRWDLNLNFSKNTTEVVEFAPGVENIYLGGYTNPQIRIEDTKNGYGIIWSSRYQRNDEGELLINDNGLPAVDPELGVIGRVSPDWTANLLTSFNYKGFGLSALFDKRQGGDVLNFDLYNTVFYGTAGVTENRGSTYVYEGVNIHTGDPNEVEITRDQAYYQGHYANVYENFVEDGSFLKLRQLSLSYTVPPSILARSPFRGLTLTGTGRNLWIDSDFSFADPEGNLYGAGNTQGFYNLITPASRSFSLTLNVSF